MPQGYTAKGLEKLKMNLVYKDEEGKDLYGFISDYELKGNIIIVNCKEYYSRTFYPKSRFETFKKVINAAADFNKISILIQKK